MASVSARCCHRWSVASATPVGARLAARPTRGRRHHAFRDVVAVMPGWACVCSGYRRGEFRSHPIGLSCLALLAGPLRPDLLVTRVAETAATCSWTTEVSWQRTLIDSGVPTLAVVDRTAP